MKQETSKKQSLRKKKGALVLLQKYSGQRAAKEASTPTCLYEEGGEGGDREKSIDNKVKLHSLGL